MKWLAERAGTGMSKTTAAGVVLLFFLPVGARLQASDVPPEELQTAEQIRQLTGEQAASHYPVKLRGVVTFF